MGLLLRRSRRCDEVGAERKVQKIDGIWADEELERLRERQMLQKR